MHAKFFVITDLRKEMGCTGRRIPISQFEIEKEFHTVITNDSTKLQLVFKVICPHDTFPKIILQSTF